MRLEALVQAMKSASAIDKVGVMQELLAAPVANQGRNASSPVDDARPHDVSDAAQMNDDREAVHIGAMPPRNPASKENAPLSLIE